MIRNPENMNAEFHRLDALSRTRALTDEESFKLEYTLRNIIAYDRKKERRNENGPILSN
jgi:hypothetical protein